MYTYCTGKVDLLPVSTIALPDEIICKIIKLWDLHISPCIGQNTEGYKFYHGIQHYLIYFLVPFTSLRRLIHIPLNICLYTMKYNALVA